MSEFGNVDVDRLMEIEWMRYQAELEKAEIINDAWDVASKNKGYVPVFHDCDDQNLELLDYLLRPDSQGKPYYRCWSFELLTGSMTKTANSYTPNQNIVLVKPYLPAFRGFKGAIPGSFTLDIFTWRPWMPWTRISNVKIGTYETFIRKYPYNYEAGKWFK
jgi:hypothetical protein